MAALCAASLMMSSCASSPSGDKPAKEKSAKKGKKTKVGFEDYVKMIESGDFESAIAHLNEKNTKKGEFKPSKDYIRDEYDMAMMNHLQKKYKESSELMLDLNQRMEDSVTKSISKGASAAALNENNAEYAAAAHEYFLANIFNSLNYYNQGDVDSAAVEIRQVNDKLKKYQPISDALLGAASSDEAVDADAVDVDAEAEESGDEEVAAKPAEAKKEKTDGKAMLNVGLGLLGVQIGDFKAPPKPTFGDIYADSAAARYMSMLFYMMDGDADNARLDADKLKKIHAAANEDAAGTYGDEKYNKQSKVTYANTRVFNGERDAERQKLYTTFEKTQYDAVDTNAEINIPAGMGRVNVLAFTGLIGRKGEDRSILEFAGKKIKGKDKDGNEVETNLPPFDLELVNPVYPASHLPRYSGDENKGIWKGDYETGIGVVVPLNAKPVVYEKWGYRPAVEIKVGRDFVLPKTPDSVKAVKVTVKGADDVVVGEETTLSLIEDFSEANRHVVNFKSRKAFNRAIPRSIIKKVTTMTVGSVAMAALGSEKDITDPITGKLYGAAYKGLCNAIDAIDKTETADIRQVYALPGKLQAGGVNVEPGEYKVEVTYFGAEDSIIGTETFEGIKVEAGKPTLVEAVCTK